MKNSFLKRFPLQIAVFIGCLGLIQCTNVLKRTFPDSHNSHNSANTLDWQGTYRNTIPNVNYSGTITELTLDTMGTYILRRVYLSKGVQPEKGTERSGNLSWNRAGNTITLLGITNQPHQFFVGENRLWELDRKGKKITGNDADKFILNRVITAVILPKIPTLTGHWELDFIAGSPMEFQELYPRKRPTIIFDTLNNLVSGSTSCNNYAGKLIVNNNKIDFSGPLMVTKMACLDDKGNGENLFLENLKNANNFTFNPDSSLNFIMGDIAIMRFAKK